ncbi:hypothetical protein [Mucilaginibacter sp. AK015]|uniref:hypothetical protein n=1 Tax=Mucilaginibacter sp. AK015 TaxID=2723072 RepID=UPI00161E7933|nr:hypothetical protein [Mucilaginibacter sp. AK015]MBB5395862.1 CRISPR/Cas system CMR-associated protein Cmr5 small subunit [Mucilaginibacter sp. AK015]
MIEIDGIYTGHNLYVKNPYSNFGETFCVYEVKVNGMTTSDAFESSAFEIDLSKYSFNLGDAVRVVIYHRNSCLPEILNPEVLHPRVH